MVKDPRAGRVKTRLGRDIGMSAAAWWFRHQTRALLRHLYAPKRWSLILAVAPDYEGLKSRAWPPHLPRVPQGNGDLGQRMLRMLKTHAPGPVCLIGGDIPGISLSHVTRAFKMLGTHDVVFGPAEDGGYWLVGAKAPAALSPSVFQNVRWSSEHALKDSIASLPGKRVALTDCLSDVDTVADLARRSR